MLTIPATTPDRYVTAFAALNIPLADGTAADWHFIATFLESSSTAPVAGLNYPSSAAVLGRSGVRECGRELRAAGHVGTEGDVWAADFVRAILDMTYRAAALDGARPDHIRPRELLDRPSDLLALSGKLAELKAAVSDESRKLIEEWERKELG
jgi:hypothetical protein